MKPHCPRHNMSPPVPLCERGLRGISGVRGIELGLFVFVGKRGEAPMFYSPPPAGRPPGFFPEELHICPQRLDTIISYEIITS